VIAWDDSTDVLLNPRLPPDDATRARELIARAGALTGHVWLATSGSTGRMKPVALSKEALLASARAVNAHLESDASDIWLNVLPTFHTGGLGIHARAHLSGARVETLESWDARSYAIRAAAERATLGALVPTQVYDLVNAGIRAPDPFRAIVVGGASLSEALYAEARALGWPLLPSYGCTECASQAATATLASLDDDGYPPLMRLPHLELRVEADMRLALRGASLFTGYATEDGLADPKRDGWWTTEDLGRLDGDRVIPYGRAGEVVKVGGELVIVPRLQEELEAAALRLGIPGRGALVAMPDDRLGWVVHLAVEGMSDADAARLVAAFNENVLPYERPRTAHRLATIPRSPLGKVLWGKLRELLADPDPDPPA